MQDYIVIEEYHLSNLVEEVNKLILRGYIPIGGICTASAYNGDSCIMYYQAVIKERKHG